MLVVHSCQSCIRLVRFTIYGLAQMQFQDNRMIGLTGFFANFMPLGKFTGTTLPLHVILDVLFGRIVR